jgi:serine/threonine-protein kinase
MGVVCRAAQPGLDRPVAVKLLTAARPEQAEGFAARFLAEAGAAARLWHPNIVTVFDRGVSDAGLAYVAMEYLGGLTLGELIAKEGPLSFPRILRLGIQIARALRQAHLQGILHLGLKPTNVMVVRGLDPDEPEHVKVLDFALSRLAWSEPGAVDPPLIGSPVFAAPEQIRSEPVDPRSDVYGFGLLMYLLAAGVHPFPGPTPLEIAAQHQTTPVVSPSELGYRRSVPPAIEALILRCLAKRPDDRFASMVEVVAAIKAAYAKPTPGSDLTPAPAELLQARLPPPAADTPAAEAEPIGTLSLAPTPAEAAFSEAEVPPKMSRAFALLLVVLGFVLAGSLALLLGVGSG